MNDQESFFERLNQLGPNLLGGLEALERARRKLHPPDFPQIREALQPFHQRLQESLTAFKNGEVPEQAAAVADRITEAAQTTLNAYAPFLAPAAQPAEILEGMHRHCQAQSLLYPVRRILPPVSRYFVETAYRNNLAELDPAPNPEIRVGIHHAGEPPPARGGFCLYVPESYDGTREWPLVVAMHGGNGAGADFLWTWLAEARGRRFLLLAPTAQGDTWSMMGRDIDSVSVLSMLEYVKKHWRVDAKRILHTGLSDGATYTLLLGLAENTPFTALAPISGVFHPRNIDNGNLRRARDKRIYLVHGALDWLFPVALAQGARDALQEAGANLVYREIPDLSHTYPREENDRILTWFDPGLALPESEPQSPPPTNAT